LLIGGFASGQDFSFAPQKAIPSLRLYAEFETYKVQPGSFNQLILHGIIPQGWHVYSVKKQEYGPHPTELNTWSQWHKALCCVAESTPQQIYDDALEMNLEIHKKKFTLYQKFKIADEAPEGDQDLHGSLRYQICDNNICAPLQEQSFVAPLQIYISASEAN